MRSIILGLSASLLIVSGIGLADSQSDLAKLKSEAGEARSDFKSFEVTKRNILSSLYEVNKGMKKMTKQRSRINDNVLYLNSNVRSIAKGIAELESRVKVQKKKLSKRLRALYMLSGQGTLQILFSSTNSSDLDKFIYYLRAISDRDYQLIQTFKDNITLLAEKRKKLKSNVARLIKSKRKLEFKEKELEKKQYSKQRLLKKLKVAQQESLKRLAEIKKETKKVIKKNTFDVSVDIDQLLKSSFFEQKKRLPLPINGIIKQRFGLLEDSQYKIRISHKGLFFSATPKSEVRSVYKGRIDFVGQIPGYGNTVIVNHGDHYYSVYSFLSEISVKFYQIVKQGDLLARSGHTSSHFGAGLYFEIRHFSDPLDPESWLDYRKLPNENKLIGSNHENTKTSQIY